MATLPVLHSTRHSAPPGLPKVPEPGKTQGHHRSRRSGPCRNRPRVDTSAHPVSPSGSAGHHRRDRRHVAERRSRAHVAHARANRPHRHSRSAWRRIPTGPNERRDRTLGAAIWASRVPRRLDPEDLSPGRSGGRVEGRKPQGQTSSGRRCALSSSHGAAVPESGDDLCRWPDDQLGPGNFHRS